MARLPQAPRGAMKLEIKIAAHEWAEFLYAEYQREQDIIRLYKKLGKVATKSVKKEG